MLRNYTGIAWKHHVSKNFYDGCTKKSQLIDAGVSSTIFLDYSYMMSYLKNKRSIQGFFLLIF